MRVSSLVETVRGSKALFSPEHLQDLSRILASGSYDDPILTKEEFLEKGEIWIESLQTPKRTPPLKKRRTPLQNQKGCFTSLGLLEPNRTPTQIKQLENLESLKSWEELQDIRNARKKLLVEYEALVKRNVHLEEVVEKLEAENKDINSVNRTRTITF